MTWFFFKSLEKPSVKLGYDGSARMVKSALIFLSPVSSLDFGPVSSAAGTLTPWVLIRPATPLGESRQAVP